MKAHEELLYITTLDFAVNPHPVEDRDCACFLAQSLLQLRQKIDAALLVCQQGRDTTPASAAWPAR